MRTFICRLQELAKKLSMDLLPELIELQGAAAPQSSTPLTALTSLTSSAPAAPPSQSSFVREFSLRHTQ